MHTTSKWLRPQFQSFHWAQTLFSKMNYGWPWKQHFISGIRPAVWPPLAWNCEEERDHNHLKRKSSASGQRKSVVIERECVYLCFFVCLQGRSGGGPAQLNTHTSCQLCFCNENTWPRTHTVHLRQTHTLPHKYLFSPCVSLFFFPSVLFVIVYCSSAQLSGSKGLP